MKTKSVVTFLMGAFFKEQQYDIQNHNHLTVKPYN